MSELRKAYASPGGGVLEVLRGVSFVLGAGEMLAVMGASGAGKSTLLHLLGGLDAADGGRARLGEVELTRAGGAQLARVRNKQVGFVFQFHHLLPDLSALENVALPLLVARRKPREARAAASAMLEAVGLGARASHRPGELSGGEQQRAAVARALVHAPRLVLADEPTGNLDARAGAEVAALLSTLARTRGAAVIVATHNEQLAAACDRTLFLKDGLLVEQL
ncbi:MAG: lipoprotein-releasing system ATP-binding protein [Pyrinomonadaceae bacterium]|nr:lipoprotein-releasing system ATP-binding protein [Pyrinomonadaceae bacterium]